VKVTYYLSRNTNCSGDLSPAITVWWQRPTRMKLAQFVKGYVWIGIGEELGLYGDYSIDEATRCFKTIPGTDLELIVCEQNYKDAR
jgi:hypothetical protein